MRTSLLMKQACPNFTASMVTYKDIGMRLLNRMRNVKNDNSPATAAEPSSCKYHAFCRCASLKKKASVSMQLTLIKGYLYPEEVRANSTSSTKGKLKRREGGTGKWEVWVLSQNSNLKSENSQYHPIGCLFHIAPLDRRFAERAMLEQSQ